LERKISENNKELRNYVREIRDEMKIDNEIDSEVESKLGLNIEDNTGVTDEISSKDTGVEVEVNNKFEELADNVYGEVKDMAQYVQVEDDNCNEETLKRQGERAAQLKSKSKELRSELHEGLNKSQVREVTLVQNKGSSFQISPTQVDPKITTKKTSNYKCICMFTKYAYNFRTARRKTTLYERDKFMSYKKVTKYKKCKKLEWCINVKRKVVVYTRKKPMYV
jgi:hypothetical protein